jgi:hypothetical protein
VGQEEEEARYRTGRCESRSLQPAACQSRPGTS